jgi:hypothetical protein
MSAAAARSVLAFAAFLLIGFQEYFRGLASLKNMAGEGSDSVGLEENGRSPPAHTDGLLRSTPVRSAFRQR